MSQPIFFATAMTFSNNFEIQLHELNNDQLEVYIFGYQHVDSDDGGLIYLGNINKQQYIYDLIELIGSNKDIQLAGPFDHPDKLILDIHGALPFDVFEEQLLRIAWCKNGFYDFYAQLSQELLIELFVEFNNLYHPKIRSLAEKISNDCELWKTFVSEAEYRNDFEQLKSLPLSILENKKPSRGRIVTDPEEWRRITGQTEDSHFEVQISTGESNKK